MDGRRLPAAATTRRNRVHDPAQDRLDNHPRCAAVTGQLAGALYGLTGIPEPWRDRIVWKDRLLTAARRLLPESMGSIQRSR